MTKTKTFSEPENFHGGTGVKLPAEDEEVKQIAEKKIETNIFHKTISILSVVYIFYSLFGMVAWVSHLGARIPALQLVLPGQGYAHNSPVKDTFDLFLHNGLVALGFVLPHTFLRPPQLTKIVGTRYARLLYCVMAAATCHLLIAQFRPINMQSLWKEDYVYDEAANVPLFYLPVPKVIHDVLSIAMLAFAVYATCTNADTYIILGFNRAYYGPRSGLDKFPKGLSPRMDIITWMGYAVWLQAGSLGFILFSGLSILPYKVYTLDIILRVVAAAYLRVRSQGFRIWVGRIEQTHHLIWVIRGLIVVAAMGYQYMLLTKAHGEGEENEFKFNKDVFDVKSVAIMATSGLAIAVVLDRLEKIR